MYNKPANGNYKRLLPKGQSAVRTKRGLRLWTAPFALNEPLNFAMHPEPITHWQIDGIDSSKRPAAEAVKALQRDIEAFGVAEFEIALQRVFGIKRLNGLRAQTILEKKLSPDEQRQLENYRPQVCLTATELDFNWMVQTRDKEHRIWLPKTRGDEIGV